ncbi:MAG: hypothetical protein LUC31_01125 [Coprobacillus sp.]|nr:hypothetical protein [Coprobacillus sp.]
MKQPSLSQCKKYLSALRKVKGNYVTCEKLAPILGYYPEVINDFFSYFDPIVVMDYSYNLRSLESRLEEYINEAAIAKPATPKAPKVESNESEYESVNDFIYQKMSHGGFIDKNTYLTNSDLKTLKKLITIEQNNRKNNK